MNKRKHFLFWLLLLAILVTSISNAYDFSTINTDLKLLQSIHKKLFVQIQDRSFDSKIIPVPDYMLNKKYSDGIGQQVDFPGEGKPLFNHNKEKLSLIAFAVQEPDYTY